MLRMSSLAEEEQSFFSTLSRQFLRTHRPFRAIVMDRNGQPILWVRKYLHIQLKVARLTTLQIRRPFQFINSRIHVRSSEGEDGKLVGEAQQYVSICSSSHVQTNHAICREWHPWRRRYNVFQSYAS